MKIFLMAALFFVSLSAQARVSSFDLLPPWKGLHIVPNSKGEQQVVPEKEWEIDALKNNTYTYINTVNPTRPKVFIEFDKNKKDVTAVVEIDNFSVAYENKERIVYCVSPGSSLNIPRTSCEVTDMRFCSKLQKLYDKMGSSRIQQCVSDINEINDAIASSRNGRLGPQDKRILTKYMQMAGKEYARGIDLEKVESSSPLPYGKPTNYLYHIVNSIRLCEARGFDIDGRGKMNSASEGEPVQKKSGGTKKTITR